MNHMIDGHSGGHDRVPIAHELTADGPAHWCPSTVRDLLRGQDSAVLAGVVA